MWRCGDGTKVLTRSIGVVLHHISIAGVGLQSVKLLQRRDVLQHVCLGHRLVVDGVDHVNLKQAQPVRAPSNSKHLNLS